MSTRVFQDGERIRFGSVEEFCEIFYDVSANALIIQAPTSGTSNTPVDRIVINAGGGITIGSSGFLLTAPTGTGLGYGTGAGGAVTQSTSRSTGVTLNTLCGTITGDASSLAAETIATFTVTNSTVALRDTVVLSVVSGPTGAATHFHVSAVAAGSFNITASNDVAAGGTADTGAPIINFAVIKAVNA